MSQAMMMEPSDEDALAAHFFEIAEARAKAAGRLLGEGADSDLKRLTRKGAKAILKEDESKRAKLIRSAERDIVRLIKLAIEEAAAIPDYPRDLLGENSYFPAKLRFCPCRPFC